jgi:S-adenosylmethionine:tRNA ribosyltransferase-isomerase
LEKADVKLNLEDYAYDLPPELIAQEPAEVRHESRLLYVDRKSKALSHHQFKDVVDLLCPGDLVVVNDTRVIPARLFARRQTGGVVEILLVKPSQEKIGLWLAIGTPIRRLKVGETLIACGLDESHEIKVADIVYGADQHKMLLVDLGPGESVFNLLRQIGFAPLPPYIHRSYDTGSASDSAASESVSRAREQGQRANNDSAELFDTALAIEHKSARGDGEVSVGNHRLVDMERYQTIFASQPGAVAAPTAGLHFTDQVLMALQAKGIELCKITLHVGPGTFKPISESIEKHQMEREHFWIAREAADRINSALSEGRRIIAVGTTTCRALESAFDNGGVRACVNESTALFIKPGYRFRVINGLITNFHLSKSSLLLLVSAFAGRDLIMDAYQTAIENRYRFYSYGDAMLIL